MEAKRINIFPFLRILIGIIFIVSGVEKLMSPYQNFLYVIQNYDLIGPPWDEGIARVFPWIELMLGVFAVLGLWTKWSLRGLMALSSIFILVVAQAITRNLPINECGCFGGALSIPLPAILLFDGVTWLCLAFMIKRDRTLRFSLDEYFRRKN